MNDEHHQGGGPEPRGIDAVQQPDHATIARFHDRHVGEVFVQVLRLCAEAGLVRVGLVAVDGTKIDADASSYLNMTWPGDLVPRHGRGFPHSGGRVNLSGASAAAFELPPWPR